MMSWMEWATIGFSVGALAVNAIALTLIVRFRREVQE